jgi:hypothetical protein
MVLAEFFALIAAVAPAHPAVAEKPLASTYDAILATEETPNIKNLAKPAVFVGDGTKDPIIGCASPGPIA